MVDRLSLASGNLATAHADFVEGWEPRRFEREIEACVHRDLVCNVPDDFSVVGAILSVVDLVIFDCDGVLVDSERLIVKVEAQICAERGWNITEDDIVREFVGLSDEAMRARLSELVGEVLDADWDAEYTDRYRAALGIGPRGRAGGGLGDRRHRVRRRVDVRGLERQPREDAPDAWQDRSVGPLRRAHLQLDRPGRRTRQAGARPVPPRRSPDEGGPRAVRGHRGQPVRHPRGGGGGHGAIRLRRKCDSGRAPAG